MPVSTLHPTVEKHLPIWKRIEDCIAGPDQVKAGREIYLPKLSGSSLTEYNDYLNRALFFNASDRTLQAMIGFLFRKPPQDELPTFLDDVKKDAGCNGVPLMAYARTVANAVCSTGRGGTLVDWSESEKRPYFAFYRWDSILNWRVERREGKQVLTMLILRECVNMPHPSDPYKLDEYYLYREMVLGTDNQVTVKTWREKNPTANTLATAPGTGTAGQATTEQVGNDMILMRRGVALTFIPFVFHGSDENTPDINKSPMADITAVNISQFQTSADLEHGRHRCATPTAWAVGFGDDETTPQESDGTGKEAAKLYVGTSYAWTSTNTDAKCGYLEFTGAGLAALEKGMEEKQAQMAALGARLIEPRREGVESAEALGLKASAETSTLARIGLLCTESISEAVRIAAWWMGTDEKLDDTLTYSLNKDFTSAEIPPERITALVAAHQQGKISWETFFYQMAKGEAYPADWTMEDEKDSIDANPPMSAMPGEPGAPPAKKPPAKPPAKK